MNLVRTQSLRQNRSILNKIYEMEQRRVFKVYVNIVKFINLPMFMEEQYN